jgi:hypothetical protein
MLRVLPSLLLMVSPVLAEKPAPPVKPSDTPPAAAPALVEEALVGIWHLDMEVGGVRVKGVTDYRPGGTFQSRASFVVDDETIELTLKGTWKLEGSTLTTTVTESSDPEFAAVGEVSKDEILELSATTLRRRDEEGFVVRETRADPGAKPPAKVPGKAVAPEDVKAIHAAIDALERSFREADLDGIVKGTYPGLIVQAGGEEKFRESLEGAVAMLKAGKIKISDMRLEAPAELHEAGDERVGFVPKRSTIEVDGRKVRSRGFYVAVRKAAENEWKLLDGAGFRGNPELLWTLLPKLPREVAIPAVERELIVE